MRCGAGVRKKTTAQAHRVVSIKEINLRDHRGDERRFPSVRLSPFRVGPVAGRRLQSSLQELPQSLRVTAGDSLRPDLAAVVAAVAMVVVAMAVVAVAVVAGRREDGRSSRGMGGGGSGS